MSSDRTLFDDLPQDEVVEYRDIPGFPGYRVGDDGSIWSRWKNGGSDRSGPTLTDNWHQLKGWIDRRRGEPDGYIKVGLMREGSLYRLRLHRLILLAFVGPCPEGMEARHLDDDKANLNLWNLAWGTRKANAQDKLRNGRMRVGEAHDRAILKKADIPIILKLLADGLSRRKIAARFGVSKGAIDGIHRGDTWKEVPRQSWLSELT